MAEAAWASSVLQDVGDGTGYAPTATLRADLATTTSYVASSHVKVVGAKKIALLLKITWVDSTSTEWYVEWSHDGTTFYRSPNLSPSSGTNTVYVNSQTHASGASVNICDSFDAEAAYMRVNVKKTGGVGADKAEIIAQMRI